ncbi:conserved Plasmodium protein, unknown function [Plasmodium vinckei vinckei]|uniref:Sec16 Sec23-binding domain-containing protein n=1 Tax=Plasmodium vinckei vinckei TaxID=54757 RepID=A0A449BSC1_PLAVN|nr:conserved Plasmodium protein, unknown function [Plasmodium vinckei vinckei]KEG02130.1 hypothetical protein YYE_02869 [Plasmodium vinckei vinckei]VEV56370.1 conserved Plasmodium protein, unknown function [Plasmodium vinckei vinckei]
MSKGIFSYENIFKSPDINKIQEKIEKSQNEADNKETENVVNAENLENLENDPKPTNNINNEVSEENENKIQMNDNSKQKIKKDIFTLFNDKNDINNKEDDPFNFYNSNDDTNINQYSPTYNVDPPKEEAANEKDATFTKEHKDAAFFTENNDAPIFTENNDAPIFTENNDGEPAKSCQPPFSENEPNLVSPPNDAAKDTDQVDTKEEAAQDASTIKNVVCPENNLDNLQLDVKKQNEEQEEGNGVDKFMCFCFGRSGTFFYTKGNSIVYALLISVIDKGIEKDKKQEGVAKKCDGSEINAYVYALKSFPGPFSRRNIKIDEKIKKTLNGFIEINKEKYKDNIFESTQKNSIYNHLLNIIENDDLLAFNLKQLDVNTNYEFNKNEKKKKEQNSIVMKFLQNYQNNSNNKNNTKVEYSEWEEDDDSSDCSETKSNEKNSKEMSEFKISSRDYTYKTKEKNKLENGSNSIGVANDFNNLSKDNEESFFQKIYGHDLKYGLIDNKKYYFSDLINKKFIYDLYRLQNNERITTEDIYLEYFNLCIYNSKKATNLCLKKDLYKYFFLILKKYNKKKYNKMLDKYIKHISISFNNELDVKSCMQNIYKIYNYNIYDDVLVESFIFFICILNKKYIFFKNKNIITNHWYVFYTLILHNFIFQFSENEIDYSYYKDGIINFFHYLIDLLIYNNKHIESQFLYLILSGSPCIYQIKTSSIPEPEEIQSNNLSTNSYKDVVDVSKNYTHNVQNESTYEYKIESPIRHLPKISFDIFTFQICDIYEYLYRYNEESFFYDNLIIYKIYYASILLEFGLLEQAKQYINILYYYIDVIKSNKKNENINYILYLYEILVSQLNYISPHRLPTNQNPQNEEYLNLYTTQNSYDIYNYKTVSINNNIKSSTPLEKEEFPIKQYTSTTHVEHAEKNINDYTSKDKNSFQNSKNIPYIVENQPNQSKNIQNGPFQNHEHSGTNNEVTNYYEINNKDDIYMESEKDIDKHNIQNYKNNYDNYNVNYSLKKQTTNNKNSIDSSLNTDTGYYNLHTNEPVKNYMEYQNVETVQSQTINTQGYNYNYNYNYSYNTKYEYSENYMFNQASGNHNMFSNTNATMGTQENGINNMPNHSYNIQGNALPPTTYGEYNNMMQYNYYQTNANNNMPPNYNTTQMHGFYNYNNTSSTNPQNANNYYGNNNYYYNEGQQKMQINNNTTQVHTNQNVNKMNEQNKNNYTTSSTSNNVTNNVASNVADNDDSNQNNVDLINMGKSFISGFFSNIKEKIKIVDTIKEEEEKEEENIFYYDYEKKRWREKGVTSDEEKEREEQKKKKQMEMSKIAPPLASDTYNNTNPKKPLDMKDVRSRYVDYFN